MMFGPGSRGPLITRFMAAEHPARPRRTESAHASARRSVSLVNLKMADLLHTGDALFMVYRGRSYRASVARDGCIEDREEPESPHRSHVTARTADGACHYARPSNWTLDCVARHCANETEVVKTNPSGFERVRVERPDGTSAALQELRDAYMRDVKPFLHDDGDASLTSSSSSSSRKRARERPSTPELIEPSVESAAAANDSTDERSYDAAVHGAARALLSE